MSEAGRLPDETGFRLAPDGGILRELPNGLAIVRRVKHEWPASLEGLSAERLVIETDRRHGSKFLWDWTLARYVDWVSRALAELGWDRTTRATTATVDEAEPVGYSEGRLVHTIRIEISSRFVHAYPVEE